MDLFAKQKYRHSCRVQAYEYQGGKRGGMNCEIGVDIYTLLCMKYVSNENLLYSTGNSKFCSDLSGKEIQKRVDLCIVDSFCCIVETNITL